MPHPRPRTIAAHAALVPSLLRLLLLILAASFIIPPPAATAATTPTSKPSVLTSFLPIHSLAASIAGDHADVRNWLPQGVDPHDFQFSPRDIRRLRSATLLVIGGLGLEGWNEPKLRELSGNPDLRIVEAAAGLPKEALILDDTPHHHHHGEAEHDHDHDHDHGPAPNPHFWLDPLLMAHAATNIAHALQQADPSNAPAYARNAAEVVASLLRLHQDFTTTLSPASTPFITYHAAFPYLARRYNLRLVGVVESGPSAQPSARDLVDLGRRVREEKVRVLFIDGEPPRLARQLAKDLRLDLASLETLETGPFAPDAYEKGMRRNLEVLRSKLVPNPAP